MPALNDDDLERLLRNKALPRKAKLLGILALEQARPKGQRQIRRIAWHLGLSEVRRWRIGALFSELGPEVRLGRMGWILTPTGAAYVAGLVTLAAELAANATAAASSDAGCPASGSATPGTVSVPTSEPPLTLTPSVGVAVSATAEPTRLPPAPPAADSVADEPVRNDGAAAGAPEVRETKRRTRSRESSAAARRGRRSRDPSAPGLTPPPRATRSGGSSAASTGGRRSRDPSPPALSALPQATRSEAVRLLDEIAGALSNGKRTARELAWASVSPVELAAMRDAFAATFSRREVLLGLRAVRAVLQEEEKLGHLHARQLASRFRALADPDPSSRRSGGR